MPTNKTPTAEDHLRAIAACYDPANCQQSLRAMYDIARSAIRQDERGRVLDPEWAERMIERWRAVGPEGETE